MNPKPEWVFVENYLHRIQKLAELMRLANVVADQLRPDFFIDGKEPSYQERIKAQTSIRNALQALSGIESEMLQAMNRKN